MLYNKQQTSGLSTRQTLIHRAPHDPENPYTVVSNKLIDDDTLSFEMLGFLVWGLRQPDDWRINRKHILKTRHVTDYAMRRIIAGTVQGGYSRCGQRRKGKSQFDDAQYELFETPLLSHPVSNREPLEAQPISPSVEYQRTVKAPISAGHPEIDIEEMPMDSHVAPCVEKPLHGIPTSGFSTYIPSTDSNQVLNDSNDDHPSGDPSRSRSRAKTRARPIEDIARELTEIIGKKKTSHLLELASDKTNSAAYLTACLKRTKADLNRAVPTPNQQRATTKEPPPREGRAPSAAPSGVDRDDIQSCGTSLRCCEANTCTCRANLDREQPNWDRSRPAPRPARPPEATEWVDDPDSKDGGAWINVQGDVWTPPDSMGPGYWIPF
jgi:hypothetical protein